MNCSDVCIQRHAFRLVLTWKTPFVTSCLLTWPTKPFLRGSALKEKNLTSTGATFYLTVDNSSSSRQNICLFVCLQDTLH